MTTTTLYYDALADPLKLLPQNKIIQITNNSDNSDSFKVEDPNAKVVHPNISFNDSNHYDSQKLSDILTNIKLTKPITPNISISELNQSESLPKNNNEEVNIETEVTQEKRKNISIADEKEIKFRKMECLAKLMYIKNSGIQLTKNYNLNSDIESMEAEIKYHTDRESKKKGVNLAKSILCNCITGIEFLNEKYDPFGFKLNGWSDQVKTNKDDYDEVLADLYEKYKFSGTKLEPELKLILMIVISAGSFHISQSLSSILPGMDTILKNNPELLTKLSSNINKNISGDTELDKKKKIYNNLKKMKEEKNKSKKPANNNPTSVKNLLNNIKKSIPLDSIADSASITVGNTIYSDSSNNK